MLTNRFLALAVAFAMVQASPMLRRDDGNSTDVSSDPTDVPEDQRSDINWDALMTAAFMTSTATIVPPAIIQGSDFPYVSPEAAQSAVLDQVAAVQDVASSITSRSLPFDKRNPTTVPTTSGCSQLSNQEIKTSSPRLAQGLSFDDWTAQTQDPNSAFSQLATQAKTPFGYVAAPGFQNLDAVFTNAGKGFNGYVGAETISTYDPSICAAKCTAKTNCNSFNIYLTRNPSLPIKADTVSYCNNPPAITNVVCSYWSVPMSKTYATDNGQYRGNYFITQDAASNGYNLPTFLPDPLPAGCKKVDGKVDNRLATGHGASAGYPQYNTYSVLHTTILTASAFDPANCATAAYAERNAQANNPPGKQNSVASYITWPSTDTDGNYGGQGCIVYTHSWPTSTPSIFNDKGFSAKNPNTGEYTVFSSTPAIYCDLPPP